MASKPSLFRRGRFVRSGVVVVSGLGGEAERCVGGVGDGVEDAVELALAGA